RTPAATRAPVAVSTTATTARATTTSISVNPSVARQRLQRIDRNNLDSSCQPIDAHLVTDALPRQRNRASTRHSGRKEANRVAGSAAVAAGGERRVEHHVVGHADETAARAGTNQSRNGIDLGGDRNPAPHGGTAIGLEQRCGLQRIGLNSRARRATRYPRQQDGGDD